MGGWVLGELIRSVALDWEVEVRDVCLDDVVDA
jgi:hypothetical protein